MKRTVLLGTVALVGVGFGGCGLGTRPPAAAVGRSASFGAALAHLSVDNRTPYRLSIAFRPAAAPGREVGIGTVAPGVSSRLAPVPAGEAITLIARAADVGEFAIPTRSFQLGEHWVWLVPRDAPFRADGR